MSDKVGFSFEGDSLKASTDFNQDGEQSLKLKLMLKEAFGEAFDKGEAQVDVKSLSLKFELTKLKLVVDTDKDGESLLELDIDLAEAADEAIAAFSKKDD